MLKKRNVEPTPKVHDRRAVDLLANAMVAPVEVQDPYGVNGEKILAWRSLRDDPLATMLSKGEICQARYEAGREYEKNAEHAEIGNVQAMDPAKEKVDGGHIGSSDISERQIKAVRALSEARRHIGGYGDDLVRHVLVERRSFGSLGLSERGTFRKRVEFFTYLDGLAQLWGFATKMDTRG